jgi:hypothetical protein
VVMRLVAENAAMANLSKSMGYRFQILKVVMVHYIECLVPRVRSSIQSPFLLWITMVQGLLSSQRSIK